MKKHPNILYIMADQFRADVMSCVGGPARTPHLDSLAAEGMRFANCYTTTPLCVPARVSLMTGKYPHTTGSWDNADFVLSPEADLWTKMIRKQGYETAVFGKLHLCTDYGNMIAREDLIRRMGYNTVNETSGPHSSCQTQTHMTQEWMEKGIFEAYCKDMETRKKPFAKPTPLPLEDYYDVYVGRKTKEYLEAYTGDKPWFCHMSFGGPHEPWDTPSEYADQYDPQAMPEPIPMTEDVCPNRPQGAYDTHRTKPNMICDPKLAVRLRADYCGNVTLIDEMIGQVLDVIRRRGEWDDTIVLFTSDHGEMNGDHGLVKKRVFFDSAMKVPLVIRIPGMKGHVSDTLVSLMDVGPTLAELAGEPYLGYTQFGISLAPILRGEEYRHRNYVLAEYAGELMYMDEKWKMVTNKQGQVYMLFDREKDPQELKNLAGSQETVLLEKDLVCRLFQAVAKNSCLKPEILQIPLPKETHEIGLVRTVCEK